MRASLVFDGVCVSRKRKIKHADIDDAEKQEEIETEDIYDAEQREQMLDDDELPGRFTT